MKKKQKNKTRISVVLQTVKLHPSIWEPLFLTGVQGVLLSGGNTPWMSQQSIALRTSRNFVSKQPQTEGASREPGTFWLRGVGGHHVPQTGVHGRLEVTEVFKEAQGDFFFMDVKVFLLSLGSRLSSGPQTSQMKTKAFLKRSPAGAGETVHTVSLPGLFLETGRVVCSN